GGASLGRADAGGRGLTTRGVIRYLADDIEFSARGGRLDEKPGSGGLRKDPAAGEGGLGRRPADQPLAGDGRPCPFCPGNEGLTSPEIAAYRPPGSRPDSPGWQVRVVPEGDPYFTIEEDLVREGVGMFDRISTRGASEILVEHPG